MVALQGEWADEVLNTDGWDTYQVKQAKLYKELFSEGGIDK